MVSSSSSTSKSFSGLGLTYFSKVNNLSYTCHGRIGLQIVLWLRRLKEANNIPLQVWSTLIKVEGIDALFFVIHLWGMMRKKIMLLKRLLIFISSFFFFFIFFSLPFSFSFSFPILSLFFLAIRLGEGLPRNVYLWLLLCQSILIFVLIGNIWWNNTLRCFAPVADLGLSEGGGSSLFFMNFDIYTHHS